MADDGKYLYLAKNVIFDNGTNGHAAGVEFYGTPLEIPFRSVIELTFILLYNGVNSDAYIHPFPQWQQVPEEEFWSYPVYGQSAVTFFEDIEHNGNQKTHSLPWPREQQWFRPAVVAFNTTLTNFFTVSIRARIA